MTRKSWRLMTASPTPATIPLNITSFNIPQRWTISRASISRRDEWRRLGRTFDDDDDSFTSLTTEEKIDRWEAREYGVWCSDKKKNYICMNFLSLYLVRAEWILQLVHSNAYPKIGERIGYKFWYVVGSRGALFVRVCRWQRGTLAEKKMRESFRLSAALKRKLWEGKN